MPSVSEPSDLDVTPRLVAVFASAVVVIAVLGLACVLAPVVLSPPARLRPAPLFPLLREAVEGMTSVPIALLAALGLLGGLFTRLPTPLIGPASIVGLPVASIAEMFVDPSSHNMFPLEFLVYFLMAVPVILTALIGRTVRWLLIDWRRGRPFQI
jgi:hypothetical protein